MKSGEMDPVVTEDVRAAAKSNPDGWVYKIEGEFGPDEEVPAAAIVGAWKVDSEGNIVGGFLHNPNYRPNFSDG